MKKSKFITLVLITSALASCQREANNTHERKVYMRSDSTARYSHSHFNNSGLMWYYAFRPYGMYNTSSNSYSRAGYYSSGLSERSNLGSNSFKGNVARGGFGKSSFSVSS